MLYNKINEKGIYVGLDKLDEPPMIEIDGELVPDGTFIVEPIPNDIYVSEEYPAKWTRSEWVATAERPEPTKQPPTVEERLEMAEIVILEMMME